MLQGLLNPLAREAITIRKSCLDPNLVSGLRVQSKAYGDARYSGFSEMAVALMAKVG